MFIKQFGADAVDARDGLADAGVLRHTIEGERGIGVVQQSIALARAGVCASDIRLVLILRTEVQRGVAEDTEIAALVEAAEVLGDDGSVGLYAKASALRYTRE